jgi:APA family basic amino acid/polyamine antiporter
MALTVGAYVAPAWQRPIAVAAVVALTAVNHEGVRKTAMLTRAIVLAVLVALALVCAGALFGGTASADHLGDVTSGGVDGILRAAGLLFFAFAGYARIATLGEEVIDPARTIPRAIPLALGITLAVYALVAVSAVAAVGPDALAAAEAPLATAVRAGSLDALAPLVRVGGAVAGIGVLLSLLAGVGRTTFAMAADRVLPGWLDAVHPTRGVPHRAGFVVGIAVTALVLVTDLRGAIGFSSFCVLTYYAIANASAWTLRRTLRPIAGLGLAGCALLALTLPASSVVTGSAVLALGAVLAVRRSPAATG